MNFISEIDKVLRWIYGYDNKDKSTKLFIDAY